MNICIPVLEDLGLESPVSAHFGSAPLFIIVDTETALCRPVLNQNLHHSHGMCQPLMSLAGEKLDGVVVGGIGMGAFRKLEAGGIRVFLSEFPTVSATLAAFKAGQLQPVTPQSACGGHGHGRQGDERQGNCHGQDPVSF
jgi:predicted Fe-Mo cluster-binding NifX family protein